MGFLTIVGGIILLNLAWWAWAHALVRTVGWPPRRRSAAHAGVALFMAMMIGGFVWLFLWRWGKTNVEVPLPLVAALYVWHLGVLGIGAIIASVVTACFAVLRLIRVVRNRSRASHRDAVVDPGPAFSRRQVLISAAVATPPLLTGAGVARAFTQLDEFRVREFTAVIRGLPTGLEGVTIAHVTDVHVGKFSNGPLLQRIADRVNALKPDLLLFTGDLIDYNLDDLPEALAMMHAFNPRRGMWMCEGNHDLFQGRDRFEQGVRDSGVPLLLNQSVTVTVNGCDVEIMGLRWGSRAGGRGAAIDENLDELFAASPSRAGTRILLAHHPHAFDRAAAAGIPLTLAGHTHGGQLMLTDDIGAGPAIFKYWSGLYRRNDASLLVSNGTGNWYPLRINAPAEILKVTLAAG